MTWNTAEKFIWDELKCFTWGELEDLSDLDAFIRAKNSPDIPESVVQKLENIVSSKLKLAGVDISSDDSKYTTLEKSASVIDWLTRIFFVIELAKIIRPYFDDLLAVIYDFLNAL